MKIDTFIKDPKVLLYLNLFFLSTILFILTFPYYEPDLGTGFDGAYFAMINHLFDQDVNIFKNIIHSFGPFGFLKSPRVIGNNYQIGLVVISVLRFSLIASLLFYGLKKGKSWLVLFFIIWILLLNIYLDFYIYGLITLGIFYYWEFKSKAWAIVAAIIAALSFFIKINIAIHSFLILASFFSIEFFYHKNRKTVFWLIGAYLFTFLSVWLIIYHTFSNFFPYLVSWFLFSTGNTDFSALYPPNSIPLLLGSIILFLAVPFLDRKKEVWFLFGLYLLSFFATYKYAVARQENLHSGALLHFLFYFSFFFFIVIDKIKPYVIGLFFLSIFFYYSNLRINQTYHTDDRKQLIGINNFVNEVLEQENFVNHFSHLSRQKLSVNKLPDSIIKRIGREKVDVTPWDLTYILANNLNYKPKPTLQSAALYYPSFVDQINAEHIKNSNDLKFIIWEKEKWRGEMGAIDDKYLPNEDGDYLYQVLNNYKIVEETDRIKLLERVQKRRLKEPLKLSETNATWDEWIPVPFVDSGYIRARLKMSKGFLRGMKAFLFKTGGKYVEYKLANDSIVKYRFSSNTESTGMWMNPFLTTLTNDLSGERVTHIRFTYEDKSFPMKEEIGVLWEKIEFYGR